MFIRKLSLIVLGISITIVLQAQPNTLYTVNNYSPFTVLKNGNKINPPRSQKPTKEKTTFITFDCRLNIYSYAEIPSIGINIYKNGELIKTFPMKVSGLIILNADSAGNWAGYIKTGKGVASIYTNGKFAKTVKVDETALEQIVGVEDNGDVTTLVTDKIKSQLVLKKNGNVINLKKLPKLNGRAEAIRLVGKDVHVSTFMVAYFVIGTRVPDGTVTICEFGSSFDLLCMSNQGCVNTDGTLNVECAREKIQSGVCPCINSQGGVTEYIPSDCTNDGTAKNKN